jgi:homoserine dehydrogenase
LARVKVLVLARPSRDQPPVLYTDSLEALTGEVDIIVETMLGGAHDMPSCCAKRCARDPYVVTAKAVVAAHYDAAPRLVHRVGKAVARAVGGGAPVLEAVARWPATPGSSRSTGRQR